MISLWIAVGFLFLCQVGQLFTLRNIIKFMKSTNESFKNQIEINKVLGGI